MKVKYVKGRTLRKGEIIRLIIIISALIIIPFGIVLPSMGILDWRRLFFSAETCNTWDNYLVAVYLMLLPLSFVYLLCKEKVDNFIFPTNEYTSRSYKYSGRRVITTTTVNKFGLWRLDKKAVLKDFEKIKRKKDKEALENLINYLEQLSKGFQSAYNYDAVFETYDMIVYLSKQRIYLL